MTSCQETTHLNLPGQIALTAIASFAVNGVTHPISTIKNCLMAGQKFPRSGLYRGFAAMFGVDAATFALAYYTQEELRSRLSGIASAALAGTISALPIAFGEGFMVNRQVHNLTYLESFRKATRPAGFIATALRESPFNAALFIFAPQLQENMPHSNSLSSQAASGFLSGAVIGFLTTPMDRIKTLIQAEKESHSISTIAKKIILKEGMPGLFTGSMPRTLYVGGTIAIMNIVYQIPPFFPRVLKKEG